ncbi:OX-2 membrane glycoprotein-like isoform X2 [Boleophthalmus pectinirostris]|uniref:OX-2 membrane glycoprotein-like isoform X2 n=1 Tax=Boleophthalmus pectinirostris TaxID=150288 RepID=UPI00242C60E6|nr:OX-2 membrane glycoprotein-like isoform X2 [Boleophthalmus pectinirostris]
MKTLNGKVGRLTVWSWRPLVGRTPSFLSSCHQCTLLSLSRPMWTRRDLHIQNSAGQYLLKTGANMDLIVCASGFVVLLMTAVFLEGLKIDIKAHVDVVVKAGEEARFQCPLPFSSDVLQVMWQKILPEEAVTVATCLLSQHKHHPKFSHRFRLTGAGLKNCSLVVQNVTEQDEGCYLCLFITSSDVANTGRTCLQMYELYGPTLNVTSLNSTGEQVVSCSATGRPAPKITLHVPQRHMTHNSSVTNSNGTVTVVSTAVISHRDTHITCSGTSPFEVKQVNTTVPDIKLMRNTASGPSAMDPYLAPCIFLSCGSVVVGIVAAVLLVKKNHNKESVQREHKNMENGNGITPLKNNIKEENSSLRNRTPVKNESSAKKSSRKLVL